jgi:N utilization substance protein B
MISRRNIRVKVMQLLYIIETAEEGAKLPKPVQVLKKQLDLSNELFVYLLYFITEVARYAETSAFNRAARNLPSDADLNVNTKIAGNSFLWEIIESDYFMQAVEVFKPANLLSKDLLKKTFDALTESEIYQQYTFSEARDKSKEKEIIKYIFTHLMLPNEAFIEHLEEVFTNWDDDADMMEQLVLNYIQKPQGVNLLEMVGPEKWQFAQNLLETTIDKKTVSADLIKPKLKNWDAERIALLDMILMRMGVCELLFFETIPTKVTINEYIDLAKDYSTAQSGQFVNGILDNIHKELTASGKIQKVNFNASNNKKK